MNKKQIKNQLKTLFTPLCSLGSLSQHFGIQLRVPDVESLEGLPPRSRPRFGKVSLERARSQLSTTPEPRILAPGCEFRPFPLVFPGNSFLCDRMYSHSFRGRGSGAALALIPCNPDPTRLTSDVLGRWKSKLWECV